MATTKRKRPSCGNTTGASVSLNPQDNGLGTAPFIAVTDTSNSVSNPAATDVPLADSHWGR